MLYLPHNNKNKKMKTKQTFQEFKVELLESIQDMIDQDIFEQSLYDDAEQIEEFYEMAELMVDNEIWEITDVVDFAFHDLSSLS